MRRHPTSLAAYARSVRAHFDLVKRLAQREFTQRFRGNMLGWSWAVLTPLLTAAAFTFVFAAVFQARWRPDAAPGGTFDFTLILLVGLAVHGLFAEALMRAPGLVISNASYVTKVVFPLEVLPLVALINALLGAAIALGIVVVGNLLLNFQLPWTIVFLPLVLAPYLVFVLAIIFFLAAIGVFFRDLGQIVSLVVTLSLFLTPIFYPVSAVPPGFRAAMYLNPLTFVVEQAREVTLFGGMPNFLGLAVYAAVSIVALAGAFWLFQRLRTGFADVI